MKKTLLGFGIVSSLLYVGIDLLAALRFADYHSFTSQAISELGAVGAPTRSMVEPLFAVYGLLLMGFGVGVWALGDRKPALRIIGPSAC